jgi:hypothetical protein
VSKFVLADSIRVVNLISKDEEGDLGELFHGEEGVELSLGLGEALVVLGVDEEDNSADFGEIIFPQAAGWVLIALVLLFRNKIWRAWIRLDSPCW